MLPVPGSAIPPLAAPELCKGVLISPPDSNVAQALVGVAARLPEVVTGGGDLAQTLIEAVGILISTDSAAWQFTEALTSALRQHAPRPEGSLLLGLLYAALSIPAVCQARLPLDTSRSCRDVQQVRRQGFCMCGCRQPVPSGWASRC